ncbi:hypothetical protein [Novosphingobium sp. 9U]|uniref:hypothetical protein n=1 Tax=Novosphingobium sp. 9U TaxID=2653158 RepID=UPI0012F05DFC|nr:hypothetical protein [Novosphingobium sp. 9U]VWX50876.1 conserved exported hypothetical protein [Novosphingobium sp. 9U]
MKYLPRILALAALTLLPSCHTEPADGDTALPEARTIDAGALAAPILTDAGEVTTNEPGKGQVPIYVLPEGHNSLQQQREQALILVRLQRRLGISTIVLEGATEIEAQPKRMDVDAAYGMFTEGDISSAEFLAAGFGVPLTAGETKEGYTVNAPKGSLCDTVAQIASLDALLDAGEDVEKVKALRTHRENVRRKLDALATRNAGFLRGLDKPGAIDCPGVTDKGRVLTTAKNAILAELVPPTSRFSPLFTRSCPAAQGRNGIPQIEGELDDIGTLTSLTDEVPEGLIDPQKKYLEEYRAFLQSRADATRTMVERAVTATENASAPIVMIVGAAHEGGTVKALRDAGVPFAVITTMSLKASGDGNLPIGESLNPGEYGRKIKAEPARNSAVNRVLYAEGTIAKPICSTRLKKPPLSINQPWARRKADVYDLSRRFADAALSGGGSTPPPPPPPGWGNDSASIDPSGAQFNRGADGRLLGVAFPLTIMAAGAEPKKTVWMYVEKRDASTDRDIDIEARLKEDVMEGRKLGEQAKIAFLSRNLKARTYETYDELESMEKLSQQ